MGGELGADEDEALEVAFFDPAELPSDMLSMQLQWIADALSPDDRAAVR